MADALNVIPFLGPYISGLGGNAGTLGQYTGNYVVPLNIPSKAELDQLRAKGLIHVDKYVEALRLHGHPANRTTYNLLDVFDIHPNGKLTLEKYDRAYNDNLFTNIVRMQQPMPSPDVINKWVNREFLDPRDAKRIMFLSGISSSSLQDTILRDRFEIPGPSDLVRFAVREGWNSGVVEQYGYHKEFPTEAGKWMNKQGYGQDIGIDIPAGGTDTLGNPRQGKATWTDLYWWSHWDVPSTGQGYEMLHRLYVDTDYGMSPDANLETKFVQEDMDKLMQVNDIPAYWRRRLSAISYNPYTRVDIRRMNAMGILDDAGVYHAYRAAGYNDEKAKNLLAFTKELNKPKPRKPKEHFTEQQIYKMYTLGILDEDGVSLHLTRLGFTLLDIQWFQKDYDLRIKLDGFSERYKGIKEGYMKGMLSDNDAIEYFEGMGAHHAYYEEQLKNWEIERLATRKEVSAKQAIEWYKSAIINRDEVIGRLQNLNYKSVDITNMLKMADAQLAYELYKAQVKQLNLNYKVAKQNLKVTIRELKQNLKASEDTLKKLMSAFTLDNLKTWLIDGTISIPAVRDRLKLKEGWSDADIDRWIYTILDKEVDKENEQATKKKSSSK